MKRSGLDGLAWLIKNCPWKYNGEGGKADVFAGIDEKYGPCVMVLAEWWDGGWPDPSDELNPRGSFLVVGASLEEAIQKACERAEILIEKAKS